MLKCAYCGTVSRIRRRAGFFERAVHVPETDSPDEENLSVSTQQRSRGWSLKVAMAEPPPCEPVPNEREAPEVEVPEHISLAMHDQEPGVQWQPLTAASSQAVFATFVDEDVMWLAAYSLEDGSRQWRFELGEWEPEAIASGPKRVVLVLPPTAHRRLDQRRRTVRDARVFLSRDVGYRRGLATATAQNVVQNIVSMEAGCSAPRLT